MCDLLRIRVRVRVWTTRFKVSDHRRQRNDKAQECKAYGIRQATFTTDTRSLFGVTDTWARPFTHISGRSAVIEHGLMRACMLSRFSCVRLFANLWTLAHQARLSVGFSRQESLSGLHALFQGLFLTQELNPCLLCLLQWEVGSLPLAAPGKALNMALYVLSIFVGGECKFYRYFGSLSNYKAIYADC